MVHSGLSLFPIPPVPRPSTHHQLWNRGLVKRRKEAHTAVTRFPPRDKEMEEEIVSNRWTDLKGEYESSGG